MVRREVSRDSYTGIKEIEDLSEYKLFDRELEQMTHFVPRPIEPEPEKPKQKEHIVHLAALAGTAMDEKDEIQSLKRLTPEIVGTLFDRVDFLRERIEEIQSSIRIREDMHRGMMDEIDVDIAEKQQIETSLVDIDEKRNFKLDISLLRREKRHESVQFWRDMVELKTEVRELIEQLETESKIVNIFNELKDEHKATANAVEINGLVQTSKMGADKAS